MESATQTIRTRLFLLQDADYRLFQSKLMPTVPMEAVIGVRTPALRLLARQLSGTSEAAQFLQELPHSFFEENQLHSFLLASIRDYAACIAAVERFLPYVDNWATCDQLAPPALKHDLPALLVQIRTWLASGQTYPMRFAIGTLMRYYLDACFDPEYPALVASVVTDEYYVNMMCAWYFATALAKQPAAVLPYLEQRRLCPWVHRKAIQKAIESNRISPARKAYLKTLK